MENKQEYLDRLQIALQHSHNCGAVHIKTVSVEEIFEGRTAWQVQVEVFEINGHPQATRAYGWSWSEASENGRDSFVTILEIPPVDSPSASLRASMISEIQIRQ